MGRDARGVAARLRGPRDGSARRTDDDGGCGRRQCRERESVPFVPVAPSGVWSSTTSTSARDVRGLPSHPCRHHVRSGHRHREPLRGTAIESGQAVRRDRHFVTLVRKGLRSRLLPSITEAPRSNRYDTIVREPSANHDPRRGVVAHADLEQHAKERALLRRERRRERLRVVRAEEHTTTPVLEADRRGFRRRSVS